MVGTFRGFPETTQSGRLASLWTKGRRALRFARYGRDGKPGCAGLVGKTRASASVLGGSGGSPRAGLPTCLGNGPRVGEWVVSTLKSNAAFSSPKITLAFSAIWNGKERQNAIIQLLCC